MPFFLSSFKFYSRWLMILLNDDDDDDDDEGNVI